MCQTYRNLPRPDTFSSNISSRSHVLCTGRHISYKILCRNVQMVNRRGRYLTESGVANTGDQLLAQIKASEVGRQVFIRMSIQGIVLWFRPKDTLFWIDPIPLSCALLKRALLKKNSLDSPRMLVDRTQHAETVLLYVLGSYWFLLGLCFWGNLLSRITNIISENTKFSYFDRKKWTLLSPVATFWNTSLTFNNSTFCPHSVFMCFVWNLAEIKITIFQVSKLPSQQQHDLQYGLTQHTADSANCTFVYKPQKYN